MTATATTKLLVTASLLTLTIGSIDAGISGDWDLFVIFLIAIGLSLTLLIRLESRRPAIAIRRDLVAWLEDRASVSGESLQSVTDRAIATFADRYGKVIDPEDAQQ